MKANFNPILPYFSLHMPLRSLYCIFNCSDMLLWSTVIQITQIQLSTNTHFWVINWNHTLIFFPSGHLAFMQYGWQRWKATTAALLSPIFWLQGHIPNQKSLWELFTQDGTDQPHWLMDYKSILTLSPQMVVDLVVPGRHGLVPKWPSVEFHCLTLHALENSSDIIHTNGSDRCHWDRTWHLLYELKQFT